MTASAVAEGVTLWYNWLGIFIFYASVCSFSYLQYRDQQAKSPQTAPQEGDAEAEFQTAIRQAAGYLKGTGRPAFTSDTPSPKSAAGTGKPSERTPLTAT